MERPPAVSDAQRESAVSELRAYFGRNVNKDALSAVLQMFNYDAAQARAFLEADVGDAAATDLTHFDPRHQPAESLPANYFDGLSEQMASLTLTAEDADVFAALRNLFVQNDVQYTAHLDAVRASYARYAAVILVLLRYGVELKDSAKSRALAALWAEKHYDFAEFLLSTEHFGVVEVVRAVTLLDTNRCLRSLRRRLARAQTGAKPARPAVIKRLEKQIKELEREPVPAGSLSGALIRHIKRWVMTIRKADLIFYALQLPRQPWVQLSDLLHLNPLMDFSVPWFLKVAYGEPAPEGTPVADSAVMTSANIVELVGKHQLPYSFLRHQRHLLADENLRATIASYTPLDLLVWYYEELACPQVEEILRKRLAAGEKLQMTYGKLMERVLTFRANGYSAYASLVHEAEKAHREHRSLQIQGPLVCFGDVSFSMDVALRVSTIIASLLAAIGNADLVFFAEDAAPAPRVPTTIQEVVDVTMEVKCHGLTAPAAALWPYYDKKQRIGTLLLVTDEVENIPYQEMYFAQLYAKYLREVSPDTKLVMVSFLPNPMATGRMTQALAQCGIKPTIAVKLDGTRPDLTKLDSLLGLLATQAASFAAAVEQVTQQIEGGASPALRN